MSSICSGPDSSILRETNDFRRTDKTKAGFQIRFFNSQIRMTEDSSTVTERAGKSALIL